MNEESPQALAEQVLRLREQFERLANRIESLAFPLTPDPKGARTPQLAIAPGSAPPRSADCLRRPRPPLPDPRLIQRIVRQRRLREHYFESELFADPAWDILLDLAAARADSRRVSVTSLCIAAAVPATTALRWIAQMTAMGLLVRQEDAEDRRRAFIALSDDAASALARYFDELGRDAARMV